MSKRQFYITTAIPYVNGDPHVGFALECVQADVLARHRRLRGEDVRFLSGTDDNSLKNVQAADAAGVPVAKFVSEKARRFAGLPEPLELSYDDFISTSVDPRHRPAVERLWRACAAAGDLYEREYQGLYCIGCEAFLGPAELVGGLCPEHPEPPELVTERNWFFRLSAHQQPLLEAIQSGRLRIEPDHARNEALSFIRRGLEDFSVSRPIGRARGWGIAVPGDPSQVINVWFDALCNYISALGYGGGWSLYDRWWGGPGERVHVIGKGITRGRAASRGHHRGAAVDRRCARALRLPRRDVRAVGDRRRGQPLHLERPPVGSVAACAPGRCQRTDAPLVRDRATRPGVHHDRARAAAIPPGRGGPDHRSDRAPGFAARQAPVSQVRLAIVTGTQRSVGSAW
ncbi:MAG: methionine--tRNA ligase [Solirubrobacteraceae bacterium]